MKTLRHTVAQNEKVKPVLAPSGHCSAVLYDRVPDWLASLILVLLLVGSAHSQTFGLNWFTIDGGGGTSTGGVFSASGTIGQPDAGIASGGGYTLSGGFWSVVAA